MRSKIAWTLKRKTLVILVSWKNLRSVFLKHEMAVISFEKAFDWPVRCGDMKLASLTLENFSFSYCLTQTKKHTREFLGSGNVTDNLSTTSHFVPRSFHVEKQQRQFGSDQEWRWIFTLFTSPVTLSFCYQFFVLKLFDRCPLKPWTC